MKKKSQKAIQKERTEDNVVSKAPQDRKIPVSISKIDIAAILLIIILYGCIYIANINAYDSLMYDEAGYITMGRTLVVEHYHGIDVQGTKEFYRQPLFPLMIAASFLIFGITYTAAKIPIILSAILAMIIIYLLVQKIYDRKIAFFAAAMLGGTPLILSYVENILSDVPSVLFYALSMLSFYIGIEKKDAKYLYIAWFSFGLTFLIRYNAILIIPSVGAYLLLKIIIREIKPSEIIKSKNYLLSPLAALIPLAPYFIYQQITFGDAFIGIKAASGALNMPWGAGPWHYYLTQAPSYLTWVGFTLTMLGIAWTLYKRDKFAIYSLIWIAIPMAYFSSQILKDLRLTDTLAPPLAILAALGASKIIAKLFSRDLKFSENLASFIVPGFLLAYIIYAGYTDVLPRYQQVHALGYPSLQMAGDWIQKNTEKDAILMTASEPGHQWYSYRKTIGYPEESKFESTITEKDVDYIIIDNYERMQPQYVFSIFGQAFLTHDSTLKHPEDAGKIKIIGNSGSSMTIIVPADLMLERMRPQP